MAENILQANSLSLDLFPDESVMGKTLLTLQLISLPPVAVAGALQFVPEYETEY